TVPAHTLNTDWNMRLHFMEYASVLIKHYLCNNCHLYLLLFQLIFHVASGYTLYMGRFYLYQSSVFEHTRSVSKFFVYPGYQSAKQGKNMALVQLSLPVTFKDYILPICLPSPNISFSEGLMCWVTGWGTTTENGNMSQTLQEVEVPIISRNTCSSMYVNGGVDGNLLSDVFCTGYTAGKKDSCQCYSSGPLVCKMTNDTWVQAGIVSFGPGCAGPDLPDAYVQVKDYTHLYAKSCGNLEKSTMTCPAMNCDSDQCVFC
uniref:Peptidase S1 domain-containing protein n=1 Tax=Erpetoichthys calabaricus TaxID=27687 RepID=A0A8C4SV50_ERPCA